MKNLSTIFLQAVTVFVGIVALALLIRLPLLEGRAQNLDLFSIYIDPFILYGYATSISFFIGLYKAFILFGYIRHGKMLSQDSLKALRVIKYCAITFSILIVMAGVYIAIFHDKEDDSAGFLAMCIVITSISIAVAIVVARLEKILKNAIAKFNED